MEGGAEMMVADDGVWVVILVGVQQCKHMGGLRWETRRVEIEVTACRDERNPQPVMDVWLRGIKAYMDGSKCKQTEVEVLILNMNGL